MATQNTITLPRRNSSSKYAIPAVPKVYSGGNNVFQPLISKFIDGGEGKIYGSKTLPKSLDNSAAVKAVAVVSLPSAGSAGEEIRLGFAYRATDPRAGTPETLDPSSATESTAQSVDVSSWGAGEAHVVEFTLTQANLAGEDFLDYYLQRDATHADDDYADDVLVHALYLLASF